MASTGCVISVVIARSHDKATLCAYTDPNYANSSAIRTQQQRILERGVNNNQASGQQQQQASSSSSAPQYTSFDHKETSYFVLSDPSCDLTIITALNKLLIKNSGDVQGTNALACAVLDAVLSEFRAMYPAERILNKNLRPYEFIQFDTALQKTVARVVSTHNRGLKAPTKKDVTTPGGHGHSAQYDTLKQELSDVHVVIRQNLDDILTRGERLETMNTYSAQLREHSGKYYKRTVQMNRMRLLKTYGPPLAVIIIVALAYWLFVM